MEPECVSAGTYEWEWQDGWLQPTVVKPGQIAIIGPYTDFEQGQQVLIQEADIRCIVD